MLFRSYTKKRRTSLKNKIESLPNTLAQYREIEKENGRYHKISPDFNSEYHKLPPGILIRTLLGMQNHSRRSSPIPWNSSTEFPAVGSLVCKPILWPESGGGRDRLGMVCSACRYACVFARLWIGNSSSDPRDSTCSYRSLQP